jgi:hypothetical protein
MRHEDWPQRLAAAIEAARRRPFAWGQHDCVMFAAGVVLALTGSDPMARWRGTYDDALSALRALEREGGMEALWTRALGPAMPPLTAQRGDVVLFDQPDIGETIGVCTGHMIAGPGRDGALFVPMRAGVMAWRV